jgi:hypothetical protein
VRLPPSESRAEAHEPLERCSTIIDALCKLNMHLISVFIVYIGFESDIYVGYYEQKSFYLRNGSLTRPQPCLEIEGFLLIAGRAEDESTGPAAYSQILRKLGAAARQRITS